MNNKQGKAKGARDPAKGLEDSAHMPATPQTPQSCYLVMPLPAESQDPR